MYGIKCAKCSIGFSKNDFVMRARAKVYHIECFRCVACSRQLIPGDEFALREDGLFCRADHDVVERASLGAGDPLSPLHPARPLQMAGTPGPPARPEEAAGARGGRRGGRRGARPPPRPAPRRLPRATPGASGRSLERMRPARGAPKGGSAGCAAWLGGSRVPCAHCPFCRRQHACGPAAPDVGTRECTPRAHMYAHAQTHSDSVHLGLAAAASRTRAAAPARYSPAAA